MSRIIVRRRVTRLAVGEPPVTQGDVLAVEEPLEIRVGGPSLTVTMRIPGNDYDLAAGFLVSEGGITHGEHFSTARYCAGVTVEGRNTHYVLDVTPASRRLTPVSNARFTRSVRAACGKASIDAVRTQSAYDVRDHVSRVDAEPLNNLSREVACGASSVSCV